MDEFGVALKGERARAASYLHGRRDRPAGVTKVRKPVTPRRGRYGRNGLTRIA